MMENCTHGEAIGSDNLVDQILKNIHYHAL